VFFFKLEKVVDGICSFIHLCLVLSMLIINKLASYSVIRHLQWRNNRACKPCSARGPSAVGGPKFARRCFF